MAVVDCGRNTWLRQMFRTGGWPAVFLYANGCSMTYGMELIDDPDTGACLDDEFRERHSWPGQLGRFLGADRVVNDAVVSGSNARVVRTTMEWVSAHREVIAHEPGLVVIGWSGAMRREFFVEGQFRQVIPYQEHRPDRLQELVRVYRETAWHDIDDAERLLTDVLSLQNFLLNHGTAFVLFDAIDESWDVLGRGGLQTSARIGELDRHRYLGFGAPASSMSKRLRATDLPWAGRHPSVAGHEFWASEIAAFIMARDLMKPDHVGAVTRSGHPDPPPAPTSEWAGPDRSFIYP